MSSTNCRSNVGAIRSMQIDRGARIRTFRQLNQRDTAIEEDTPHVGDTNGERYTQVPWMCVVDIPHQPTRVCAEKIKIGV